MADHRPDHHTQFTNGPTDVTSLRFFLSSTAGECTAATPGRAVGSVLFTTSAWTPAAAMMGVGLMRFHGEPSLADQLSVDGTHPAASRSSWQLASCQGARCTRTFHTHTHQQATCVLAWPWASIHCFPCTWLNPLHVSFPSWRLLVAHNKVTNGEASHTNSDLHTRETSRPQRDGLWGSWLSYGPTPTTSGALSRLQLRNASAKRLAKRSNKLFRKLMTNTTTDHKSRIQLLQTS